MVQWTTRQSCNAGFYPRSLHWIIKVCSLRSQAQPSSIYGFSLKRRERRKVEKHSNLGNHQNWRMGWELWGRAATQKRSTLDLIERGLLGSRCFFAMHFVAPGKQCQCDDTLHKIHNITMKLQKNYAGQILPCSKTSENPNKLKAETVFTLF